MQIQFDPRDPAQLTMVAQITDVLSGGNALASASAVIGTVEVALEAEPLPDAEADAAAAFETPAAAAPAVAPAAVVADTDDSEDEPAVPAVPVTADAADDSDERNAPAAPSAPDTAATTPPPTPVAASPAKVPEGVEVDARGLPWDKRAHAGSAKKPVKLKNGDWRKRRGVDQAVVDQVEAELAQIMAADGTPAAPATGNAPAAPASAAPPASPAPAAPAQAAAPAAPVPTPPAAPAASGPAAATPAPEPTPPAAPAGEEPPLTFATLMKKVTTLQAAGSLTVPQTTDIAVSLGLTAVKDLLSRPDLVPAFNDSLAAFEGAA